MRTIVSKFGGSSTANAAQFRAILDILRANPARRCAVLSAPGVDGDHPEKVTALLERCWRFRRDPARLPDAMDAVAARYREIAEGLGLPDVSLEVRRELLRALSVSRDSVLSRGEALCARLFARWSGLTAVDAASLIRFDRDGSLDEAETHRRLHALSDAQRPVIVPGFYGADENGSVRVFPKNGSDITGALVAEGFGAGLYENWTDVPGLMTADPALVPGAKLIPQVSYRQMRMLARAGAQVLHPACLDPVAMAGIPTRLRQTGHPECFGTLIDDNTPRFAPALAGMQEATLPGGVRAACVSAFGVPHDRVRRAAEALSPLCVEKAEGATRVYVRPEDYAPALRALHKALIGT